MRATGPAPETVLNWFVHHPPQDAKTVELHESIRKHFRETASGLIEVLPEGPDKTLALRKLQEAMMFANACVANASADVAFRDFEQTPAGLVPRGFTQQPTEQPED